jgi:amino acid transporter
MAYEFAAQLSLLFQTPPLQQTTTDKALELAVSFSQSLTQWAYIVLGGSVAILFRDLKYRPKDNLVRHSFWLFIPGWASLVLSIYEGMRVQQRYVARWMNPNTQINDIVAKFNFHTLWQLRLMELGLSVFALWLIAFLTRWIIYREKPSTDMGLDEW